ncbi:MAG: carbohydrate ABC transporter permease, partial [Huintestinicola sp.]
MTSKHKVPPQVKHKVKSANDIGKGKSSLLSRRTKGDIIFDTVNLIIMIVFTITMLYPLLNTVAVSFNDGT